MTGTATTMKAAIYTGIKQIELQEFPRTSPPPGYALINMRQVGICGSDLHHYFGEWPASPDIAYGHETCGVVAEVGEGVTNVQVGDPVVVECFSHCGTCLYCKTGHYNHCLERASVSHNQHGGFAEYSTVHASGLFTLPAGMSMEEGALVEPLAVAVRTLAQANAAHVDRVAIIGGGTIGQLCLAMAKAIGVQETLITVKYPQQAALAEALGADHIIDVNNTDQVDAMKKVTNGLGMDVVIETVGGARNFDATLAAVRKRGRVVLVAGYFEPLTVNLAPMVWSEAIITGSNCYGYSGMTTDFAAAIDLIQSGKIDPKKLVTHRFGLEDIAEAFAISADKKSGAIKVHVSN